MGRKNFYCIVNTENFNLHFYRNVKHKKETPAHAKEFNQSQFFSQIQMKNKKEKTPIKEKQKQKKFPFIKEQFLKNASGKR